MRRLYRRVIIESPFGAPTPEGQEENLRYLRACMRDCLDRGEAPFASHGLYTQPGVLNDWDPQEREKGILAGFEWRLVAQATIVYADRGITPGMRAGIRKATELQSAGPFDHYVEYRFLGGEWSALGGPEEIRKHLEGLLVDEPTKHRHLALVTGPAGMKQVQMVSTPHELSMAQVAVVKKVESPTGPSGLEDPPLEQQRCPEWLRWKPDQGMTDGQCVLLAGHAGECNYDCKRVDDASFYDKMSDIVEKYPPGFGVPTGPFVRSEEPNGPISESYDRAMKPIREKMAHEDLLRPEHMSENTKAMLGLPTTKFEGEFGGSGFDTSDTPGRMGDGKVLTLDEVKEALKKGGQERAEAEKTIKRPPRH